MGGLMQRGSGGGITEIFFWCAVVKRSLIGEEFSDIYTWLVRISAIRGENSWHEHDPVWNGSIDPGALRFNDEELSKTPVYTTQKQFMGC